MTINTCSYDTVSWAGKWRRRCQDDGTNFHPFRAHCDIHRANWHHRRPHTHGRPLSSWTTQIDGRLTFHYISKDPSARQNTDASIETNQIV